MLKKGKKYVQLPSFNYKTTIRGSLRCAGVKVSLT